MLARLLRVGVSEKIDANPLGNAEKPQVTCGTSGEVVSGCYHSSLPFASHRVYKVFSAVANA